MEIHTICVAKNYKSDNSSSAMEKQSQCNMDDSLTDISIGDSSSPQTNATEDEVKHWKERCEETEKQCKHLKRENERINIDLAHERYKSNKIQKKLQFIKDNQDIFMKLKEAYISLKYNEAAGNKMVEIHEKGVQTYSGILCCNCIETEKMKEQLVKMKQKYHNSVIVPMNDYNKMQATLEALKKLVINRESSWDYNMQREHSFRWRISMLESENDCLRRILNVKVEGITSNDERREENNPPINRNPAVLKRIIVKYERKLREIANKDFKPPSFNEGEKELIDQLMSKYYSKLTSKIKSRNPSDEGCKIITQRLSNEKGKLKYRSTPSERGVRKLRSVSCERKCDSRGKLHPSNICSMNSESKSYSDVRDSRFENTLYKIDKLLKDNCEE